MCSILGLFDVVMDPATARRQALELSGRQRHRGPDASGIYGDDHAVLAHERLAIVDPESGAQPLRSPDGAVVLAVNGEIYNHHELAAGLRAPYAFQTASDCEVILALWRERGPELVHALNGIFAFALWDRDAQRYVVARDPLGVCPLYFGRDELGQLWVASELKALMGVVPEPRVFPPGHVLDSAGAGEPEPYYRPFWRSYDAVAGVLDAVPADSESLRSGLETAVRRQLMSDVPFGVLLSGGLDSSLVAAIARRHTAGPLHSFSIGLDGSPDLAAARVVAAALGTEHHEFRFTVEQGLDVLPEVIRHIESYDVTTVRASTPMFLMARRIRALGFKMVLSGEGADEIFGGYLYFHKAPSAAAFHQETVRKLELLHRYDLLRANKSMAAWGVEARVPFLDLEFLDLAMGLDAEHKRVRPGGIEKRVLREAFVGYLPEEILWRQKEQFSDGVGYGWIDQLKAHAAARVSEGELRRARWRFPVNPPTTAEGYLYRELFERHFPGAAAAATIPGGPSIACSTPAAIAWDAAFAQTADPSGRAVVGVHGGGVTPGTRASAARP